MPFLRLRLAASRSPIVAAAAVAAALASPPAEACHVIVHAGGPYELECTAEAVATVALDGSRTSTCQPGPLFFVWDSDCPDAVFDDPTSVTPLLTFTVPDSCSFACEVSLDVFDTHGQTGHDTEPVVVADVSSPELAAVLEPVVPLAPAPASAPLSACSAPSERSFRVRCAVADACDPAPAVEPVLLVERLAPAPSGGCAPEIAEVPVACDEVVTVRSATPRCTANTARPPVAATSAGVRVVTGTSVVLEATAVDRCDNRTVVSFDPSAEPSPVCDVVLADGTCCPALAPASPGARTAADATRERRRRR